MATFNGDDGNNTIVGGSDNDLIQGFGGADFLQGGGGADTVVGGTGNDAVDGNDGNDWVEGGAGNDTLTGAGGTDSFVFREAGAANADVVTDFASNWDDLRLDAAGFAAIGAVGRFAAGDVRFFAGAGATGGHDADDRIVYDTTTGQLFYDPDGNGAAPAQLIATLNGAPAVVASDIWAFGTATPPPPPPPSAAINGTSGNDSLVGTAGNDTINGFAGNDTIDGGAGADSMVGGAGDDLFFVDNAGDTVVELANEGLDEVRASVSYTLSDFVNNLTLVGSAVSGTGNAIDNVITGNALNNTLNGGAGNDTLTGGLGADSFIFNQTPGAANADQITDFTSGTDNIRLDGSVMTQMGASGSFSAADGRFFAAPGAAAGHDADDRVIYNTTTGQLWYDADGNGAGAAQLIATLQGAPALAASDLSVLNGVPGQTANGTAGNDSITGSAGNDSLSGFGGDDTLNGLDGNDTLDGGTGNDQLYGGLGDDTYIVDSVFDAIYEQGSGVDTVLSSVSFDLSYSASPPSLVENLTLTGTSPINGYGNGVKDRKS